LLLVFNLLREIAQEEYLHWENREALEYHLTPEINILIQVALQLPVELARQARLLKEVLLREIAQEEYLH
jgi:hypothetical protein